MDEETTQTILNYQAEILSLKVLLAASRDREANQAAAFDIMLSKWEAAFNDTQTAINNGDSDPVNIIAAFHSVQQDFVTIKTIGLADLVAAIAPPPTDGASVAENAVNNPLVAPTDPATIVVSATPAPDITPPPADPTPALSVDSNTSPPESSTAPTIGSTPPSIMTPDTPPVD